MVNKKVSIIMANYNGAAYLKESISSVLAQTYSNYELIIIDDGSTDNSREVIESFDDERIKLKLCEKGRHVAYASNQGLQIADGEYIARLDSDDTWEPKKLEKQIQYMETHPETGACFTKVKVIDRESADAEKKYPEIAALFNVTNKTQGEWARCFLCQGNRLCNSSSLIRTSAMKQIGMKYNLAYVPAQDYELWSRLVLKYPIYILEEVLTHYRWMEGENQISNPNGDAPIENIYMMTRLKYLDSFSEEELIKHFGEKFVNSDSRSALELECEKAYLLLHCLEPREKLNFQAFMKFEQILNTDGGLELLERKFDFDLKKYYALYRNKNFYSRSIIEKMHNLECSLETVRSNQNELEQKQKAELTELKRKQNSQMRKVKKELNQVKGKLRRSESAREIAERQAAKYFALNKNMQDSLCWRITAPVRFVGDVFSQHLIGRAIQCAKEHGVSYTINLYKTGGYDKGTGSVEDILEEINEEHEFEGEIIDYFNMDEEEVKRQKNYNFGKKIKFSVLVPLYNTPERFLQEMIESVQYQTYENWELCLADGSDEEHAYVEEICRDYAETDSRILYKKLEKNGGISENTNACIDMASGEYISLFDHDDILHPAALFETMLAIVEKGADYVYTDETTFEGTNISHILTRHYKPDYAIDNLRANNYICHFSTFKKELLDTAGRFRPEFDGSQDHDEILRLTEAANSIYHIPKVLYYWRSHANSVALDINAKTYAIDAAKNAVSAHFERKGLEAEIFGTRAFPTIFRFKYKLSGTPLVSILIPNKDHVEDLEKCIRSISEKSSYGNFEIIIIENNSTEKKTEAYYQKVQELENITVVKFDGEFNYSRINNFGRTYAAGEYLILLNNDTEVISEDWIEQLLMYAQREDVGAVGAKLYFPDDTIQHAGIILRLGADRTAGHAFYGVPKESVGYMGRLCYAQNVSAVTAACLMVSSAIYDEVNGFDEDFAVALNDVDFCLKIRDKGYLNVFNPYAELYHYESKSRGQDSDKRNRMRYKAECDMFKKKWKDVLDAGDPYYNPNFSLDSSEFVFAKSD